DRNSNTVKLGRKGMRINLGGIAKGYIVSQAAEKIKSKGIKKGIIHAGGDMFVFNESDNKPFKIGIQHPREKDKIIGTIEILNGAVATSGDYERFFIKDGIRYHHIMDPKTGFPASKIRAVTIVAKDGTMADAISTAVFVMGLEDGMKLIEKLPDIEGLIIDANGNVHLSSGLKGYTQAAN
ncbi:MAG: FAD:protein FMN transferase, partial [Deltaproteobacteria bacterium]|nr:FAD:protein FMN transferase [Deltaproteobacteria bacterium]